MTRKVVRRRNEFAAIRAARAHAAPMCVPSRTVPVRSARKFRNAGHIGRRPRPWRGTSAVL
ncbi:hypothetical protein [Lysobacter gummosus]|uniref:hypothetical protein n=1 Tax=Lysobacter gummosus TaxID=262324 RepID=UPI00362E48F0